MALSGSFETSHRSYTQYPNRAYFNWSGTQSTSGNYTDISWSFTLGGGTSSTASIAIYSGSVTVDGETKSFNYSGTGYKKNGFVLASGTKRIYHNSDGTKSFGASGGVNIFGSSEYYSGSDSWTLNSIPRKATITSAPNFDDEANPTITYENKAGNSVNSLMACISLTSATDDIVYRDINKTGSSYTFELTDAERNVLRAATATANSRDVYFFVRTIIGSNTFYDYKKVTLSIVNANPTFSNFTYQDTNSTITGITGNNQVLVQGKSTLRVTVASADKATAKKSATMSNYLASISGLSETGAYSSSDAVVMNFASNAFTAGAQSLSVKATDSRGNSTSVSKSVTVLAYADPVINATAERLNNFENTTTLAISGSFSPLQVSGTAKNTIQSVQYRYKASTTSTWGSWTTAAGLSVNTNGTYTVSNITLNLNNQNAYDFEVKTTDKVGSKTVSLSVSQGQPQFFVGADGRVGIGGLPNISLPSGNLGQLEVNGDAYANGNRLAELPISTNQIANGAVTSEKIGWSSMKYGFITKEAITSWTGSALTDAYTVPEAGVYYMSGGWSIAPNGYDYRVCDFYINNSRKNGVQTYLNQRYTTTNSYITTLAAGDTVKMAIWANSANFQTLHGWLCIFRIA